MTEEVQEAIKAGWVYAFANEGMPNLLKIGKTKYTPEEKRLRCANNKDTYKSPYPFTIAMAKRVSDHHVAEQTLHLFFADKRIIPTESGLPTEFFKISIEEAAAGFAAIEGEPWVPAPKKFVSQIPPLKECVKKGSPMRKIVDTIPFLSSLSLEKKCLAVEVLHCAALIREQRQFDSTQIAITPEPIHLWGREFLYNNRRMGITEF